MKIPSLVLGFVLFATTGAAAQDALVELSVANRLGEARTDVPVTWGVPLGIADGVRSTEGLAIVRDGRRLPAQFVSLARWGGRPDDASRPIAWLLVDVRVDLGPSEVAELVLVRARERAAASPLAIRRDDGDGLTIETGAATYEVSRTAFRFFDSVVLADGTRFGPGGILLDGEVLAGPAAIRVEHRGPERISLRIEGALGSLGFAARVHFFRGLAETRIDFRLENRNPAEMSPTGQPAANDFGSAGSVRFDDVSIAFAAAAGREYRFGPDGAGAFERRIAIVQESTGADGWDHHARTGYQARPQAGAAKRASTIALDGRAQDGPDRLEGWLDAGGVTAVVEEVWQNFPKALRAGGGRIEIGLFPGEFSRDHELRAGEAKTHTLLVRHHPPGARDVASRAESLLAPARLAPRVEDLVRTRAAGLLAPRDDGAYAAYERGQDLQLTPAIDWKPEYQARDLPSALRRFGCYGWLDYGDLPTDFEVPESPYNSKYDCVRGLVLQALRQTGRPLEETWWSLARAAARHAGDVDVHHSSKRGLGADRRWFEGGMYGHGYHDERGETNPHRNRMNPSTSMAGPCAGILLWGLVAGDTLALDAGLEIAENLHWKTTHSNYSSGPRKSPDDPVTILARETGLAAMPAGRGTGYEPVYAGRTAGILVAAMQLAHLATGEPEYLDLVRRHSDFLDRYETRIGPAADPAKFHFEAIHVRSLGEYVLYRRDLALPEDEPAVRILRRRIDLMTGDLWNDRTKRFQLQQGGKGVEKHDNWLLVVADAYGAGALVLDRPELLEAYARPVFLHGSRNQFYLGSRISYHSTKEFVNQVGFGNVFLHAWSLRRDRPPRRPR